jgi:cobalt-zinc-cadmium efflux system protein
MASRPHVAEVHDLHIWEITTGMPAASAHVLVEPRQDCHAVRGDLENLLSGKYGITHLTLQVDHMPEKANQEPAACEPPPEADESPAPVESDGHHQSAASHDSHCEDSHGPAYRAKDDS